MKKMLLLLLFIILFIFLYYIRFSSKSILNLYDISDNSKKNENYGYIYIPKIKLNSKFIYNGNIEKNIVALKQSDFKFNNNSLLVLAGHSGTGMHAYFNYLYKLKLNDVVYIIYMKKEYKYKIVNILYKEKDGNLEIFKYSNTNNLILITCTNNNKSMQTVYICVKYE